MRRGMSGHTDSKRRSGWLSGDRRRLAGNACLAIGCLLLSACGTSFWSQFHADGQSQGSIGLNSPETLSRKWAQPAQLSGATYGSPVIDQKGTIYVGTTQGELVALDPDGKTKWVLSTSSMFSSPTIVSAPAISDGGDIYVIVNRTLDPAASFQLYRSVLLRVAPDSSVRCTFPFNQPYPPWRYKFTTASPKVWSSAGNDFVFVPLAMELYVVDGSCSQLDKHTLNCSGDIVGGYMGFDFDRLISYDEDVLGPHFFETWRDPTSSRNWIDPTAAVVSKINGGSLRNPIVVAAINGCGTEALEWQLPPVQKLVSKWHNPAVSDTYLSSPAVSTAGEVAIGMSSGYVWSYDLETGKQNWFFKAGEPVLATPAFYAGVIDIYVAGLTHVYQLQNGSLAAKFDLGANTVSSTALTWNKVFLSSQGGMHALTTNFTAFQTDDSIHGGMASAAIGADGTVYVVAMDGSVIAYRGK